MTRQTGTNVTLRNVHVQYDATDSDRQTVELPTALKVPPRPTYSYDDYAQEIRERLRATNEVAR